MDQADLETRRQAAQAVNLMPQVPRLLVAAFPAQVARVVAPVDREAVRTGLVVPVDVAAEAVVRAEAAAVDVAVVEDAAVPADVVAQGRDRASRPYTECSACCARARTRYTSAPMTNLPVRISTRGLIP